MIAGLVAREVQSKAIGCLHFGGRLSGQLFFRQDFVGGQTISSVGRAASDRDLPDFQLIFCELVALDRVGAVQNLVFEIHDLATMLHGLLSLLGVFCRDALAQFDVLLQVLQVAGGDLASHFTLLGIAQF